MSISHACRVGLRRGPSHTVSSARFVASHTRRYGRVTVRAEGPPPLKPARNIYASSALPHSGYVLTVPLSRAVAHPPPPPPSSSPSPPPPPPPPHLHHHKHRTQCTVLVYSLDVTFDWFELLEAPTRIALVFMVTLTAVSLAAAGECGLFCRFSGLLSFSPVVTVAAIIATALVYLVSNPTSATSARPLPPRKYQGAARDTRW